MDASGDSHDSPWRARDRIVSKGKLDLMTRLARRFGPDLNRETVENVQKAGFRIRREENVYPDIVKIIEAVKGT